MKKLIQFAASKVDSLIVEVRGQKGGTVAAFKVANCDLEAGSEH